MPPRQEAVGPGGSELKFVGNSPQEVAKQVRVLTLNDGEHQDSTLYRLQKGWWLHLRLGPSLFGRKVRVFCNLPSKVEEPFERTQYRALSWQHDSSTSSTDDSSTYIEIFMSRPGSFHYYFTYSDSDTYEPQGSGFFSVDPVLRVGNNELLPLDCIQCQTVLSKCLGPFSSWEAKLRVGQESGYNMIHFTPVQELGDSNSAYSLRNQLKLNPIFSEGNHTIEYTDIEKFTDKMRREWKVASVCDIVLNHTANETDWLQDHPECSYNLINSPHLRPAYLLDALLNILTQEVSEGKWEFSGIPSEVTEEAHLSAIRSALLGFFLPQVKIPELYMLDVNHIVSDFQDLARRRVPPVGSVPTPSPQELKIIPDPLYRRLKATVDMELALRIYNVYRSDSFDEETRLRRCSEDLRAHLDKLNSAIFNEVQGHLQAAVDNSIAGMRYFRVQSDGPKLKDVSIKNPLVPRYFTDYGSPKNIADYEELAYSPKGCFVMAHNGWVMNDDPLRNFASSDSNVYLRRELIAWGDSVKLRYGDKPDDCPFLWRQMQDYVELTAQVFDGIRLDNCHSTPIPVAEYLLDAARKVRPDLYVVAELFTNSDQKDNIFVNRLGISSLIREAMSAWDSHELGRLVYRYGGEPVGAFFQSSLRPLTPSVAHALFLDLTHDNPSPVDKRSVFDLLPSAALVSMACCASGSSRGYDELVPHHIHVVDEGRQYSEWFEAGGTINLKTGIVAAKRALNQLHYELGKTHFNQVFVDQIDSNIVAVTRHCPDTHQSVVLVAYTAFSHPDSDWRPHYIKPLRVEGTVDEIIFEASLQHVSSRPGVPSFEKPESFEKNSSYINGLLGYEVKIREHLKVSDSDFLEQEETGDSNITQLKFTNFCPGSVVVVRVSIQNNVVPSLKKLHSLVNAFTQPTPEVIPSVVGLGNVVTHLTLANLNRALYRCDAEERDEGKGFGAYDIPGFGPLVYCGLQGFLSLLADIRVKNDLGHPFCNNLRQGNWMIDYIVQRLQIDSGTKDLGGWLEEQLGLVKQIPRYLVPSYFDAVVTGCYQMLLQQAWNLMSPFVKNGSSFVRSLALGSVQCGGFVQSARLPQLSPALPPPLPPKQLNAQGEEEQACLTLSAGLPHFSTGYMRSWGRDTFIALRGLFILTGRFQEARFHILGYAACLRHGLIPNLLDGGLNSRFNCRDAVWWWLNCIQSYVEEVPGGASILQDPVSRIFPTDDSPPLPAGKMDQPLYEVMQEALTVHFQGLCFRERNAGRSIDAHMTDKGFNVQIGVHPETGFVFGGNSYNCGTWMDKMGSSEKAGTRGRPATPRDGSAVELVGLSMRTLLWLSAMHEKGAYPYSSVSRKNKDGSVFSWTYRQWGEKIAANFEKCFYVNSTPTAGEERSDLIHQRGIYKDTYHASQAWCDFQLRCNFPVAMVAAPELFNPAHAWTALKKLESTLLGPLGMKTLDPADWNYRGDYDNSNDSDDAHVAHGFNYHQGPEWLWPVGYFLRARLHFARAVGGEAEIQRVSANTRALLARHFTALQSSPWRGLPELTNSEGKFCPGSCTTQAWSMGCLLEVLHDLSRLEEYPPATLELVDN
ncbi:hypothetical protein R5R35_001895 [Gryllus longicercus]|uniref:Glycogen debranching enzyme n=1 Tax=Gryllus longicercus TaxID=2509291 RepID=A0AAN9ZAE9_9ORTH